MTAGNPASAANWRKEKKQKGENRFLLPEPLPLSNFFWKTHPMTLLGQHLVTWPHLAIGECKK